MNKQTATKNLDEIITKVEGARLRISEHHIVKIIGFQMKIFGASYLSIK